jgi:hypothetical protein
MRKKTLILCRKYKQMESLGSALANDPVFSLLTSKETTMLMTGNIQQLKISLENAFLDEPMLKICTFDSGSFKATQGEVT